MQALPGSAEAYKRDQLTETGAAVAAIGRLWRRMGSDFDASYLAIEDQVLAVTVNAQREVTARAQRFVPEVLAETGQSRAVQAAAQVDPGSLVGWAGDGRPVDSLAYHAVVQAKVAVGQGATSTKALADAGAFLTMAVGTVLADTARASEVLGAAVRPVSGYVRMINPGACSRCAILAGKWYRNRAAFARHPGCLCLHIPASESVAGDMAVDSRAYFDSMDAAQQDRTFTKAGAEAIREGADINQVVNARRGMRTAQVNTTGGWVPRGRLSPVRIGGRDAFITTEGTTRRGLASRQATGRRGARLMPESISKVAADKADYLRLLRANGYLLP